MLSALTISQDDVPSNSESESKKQQVSKSFLYVLTLLNSHGRKEMASERSDCSLRSGTPLQ